MSTVYYPTIPEIGWVDSDDETLEPSDPCAGCGHPVEMHQTGIGAFSGWCSNDCECEAPSVDRAVKIAKTYGVSVERLHELEAAPRDEDGWPTGFQLTEAETHAIEDLDTELEDAASD